MIADDLVLLPKGSAGVQPLGEPLVQLGACGLRDAVIGGVAHEQMTERERVGARDVRSFGPHELLADEEVIPGPTASGSPSANARTAPE